MDTGRVVTLEKRPYRMTVPKACIACQLTLSWSYEPGKCEKEVRLPDIKAEIRALAKKSGTDYVEPAEEPAPVVSDDHASAPAVAVAEPAAAAPGTTSPAPEATPAATDDPAAAPAGAEPTAAAVGDAAPTSEPTRTANDAAVATASPVDPAPPAADDAAPTEAAATQATVAPEVAGSAAAAEPVTVAVGDVVVVAQPPRVTSSDVPAAPTCTSNADGCPAATPAEAAAPTGDAGAPPL